MLPVTYLQVIRASVSCWQQKTHIFLREHTEIITFPVILAVEFFVISQAWNPAKCLLDCLPVPVSVSVTSVSFQH